MIAEVGISVRCKRKVGSLQHVNTAIKINAERSVQHAFGSTAVENIALISPVDTGYMRSSIKQTSSRKGMRATVIVNGKLSTRTGAFYAVYVEYGTRHMRAQPFFWPGVEIAVRAFKADMRNVFKGAGI